MGACSCLHAVSEMWHFVHHENDPSKCILPLLIPFHTYILSTYNTQLAMVTWTSPKDTDDSSSDNETQDDNEAGSSNPQSQSLSSERGGGDIEDDPDPYASASAHHTNNAGRPTVAIHRIHPKDIERVTWDKVLRGEYLFASHPVHLVLSQHTLTHQNKMQSFPARALQCHCSPSRNDWSKAGRGFWLLLGDEGQG